MRLATSLLAGAVLLCTTAAFAAGPTPTNFETLEPKPLSIGIIPDPIYINQGGDNIGTATNIPGLPYSDSGTTTGYANDYTPGCGFSNAPDVVYRFAPTADVEATVSLCGSSYDTILFIRTAAGAEIGCIDDACGLQSELLCVNFAAGTVYYIFIDGYSSGNGPYVLNVTECAPCAPCPPDAFAEGEPDCTDNYNDVTNGGCNSVPPVFTVLPCSDPGTSLTVCGTYGGFLFGGASYRDTDWYEITLDEPTTITWCVAGEYATILGIIDGRMGCPVSSFYSYTTTGPCQPGCVTEPLPAGTWWLFVATSSFGPAAGACGGEYIATLTGYECDGPIAVEPNSWGAVKALYK